MKIIRNDICYVEISDLVFLGAIPFRIGKEMKPYHCPDDKFERFTKQESINFFKERQVILDYDTIKDLSDENLDKILNDIYSTIETNAFKHLLSTSNAKSDEKYNYYKNQLNYLFSNLYYYRFHRTSYDELVSKLEFGEIPKTIKFKN